ncbi:MAG: hypothetical protein NPINA01_00730 [Nitrospinaceae bacterium]|nr:MAG: hypothetical protein NPINA01_00730 [Nitrospinaceae bacterium]
MDIPPYLEDRRFSPKKRVPAKIIFNLIFILSLGLNIYFISFQPNSNFIWSENGESLIPETEGVSNDEPAGPDPIVPDAIDPADAEPVQAESGQKNVDPVKFKINPQQKNQRIASSVAITPASYVVPQAANQTENLTENHQEVFTLQLKIRNSLTYSTCQAMTREEGCEMMSAYMSRLLSWFLDINKSLRKGDSLDVIYEKTPDKNRFRILKLVFDSQLYKETFEANFFKKGNDGFGSYYSPEGVEIAKRMVDRFAPVRDYKEITSLPGDFRKGPVGHEGTDFKTEVGTEVYSSFEGRVTRTNWNVRANGYCVELDHPREGVKTLYLHLSRVFVKPGQFVKQGEKIAETGNTGRTFAPHLHYEIKSRGKKKVVYNPFNFKHIKSFYQEVPKEERESFQETVNWYDSILKQG